MSVDASLGNGLALNQPAASPGSPHRIFYPDGRLSVEQHLELYADDLMRLANTAENLLEGDRVLLSQTLDGIEYLFHVRVSGGKLPHLSIDLCRKLLTGLLVFISFKENGFWFWLPSEPSPVALQAFRIFSEFLLSVGEFRAAVEELDVHQLRSSLKVHRHIGIDDLILPPGYPVEEDSLLFKGLTHAQLVASTLLFLTRSSSKWTDVQELCDNSYHGVLCRRVAESEQHYDRLTSNIATHGSVETILPPKGSYFDTSEKRVLDIFRTDLTHGLSLQEVERRQEFYGSNNIPSPKKQSLLVMLWRQLTDFIVLVLIVAAIVSAATGDYKSAIVLSAVVVINSAIGFYQEYSAEKTLSALSNLSVPFCKVLRDGEVSEVDASELVPGDIVVLDEGDLVPADLRIVDAAQLQVVETLLTGESVPVSKCTEMIRGKRFVPIGDRKNMAFMSTTVQRGRARAVVVNTGRSTEVGRISAALATASQERASTPLQRKLTRLGYVLVAIALVGCGLVVAAGFAHGRGSEMIFPAIALAVSTVPEGLATVTVLTLSLGVRRMARSNAIVRHLPAVETLGSATTIGTDKTGTLTEGKMRVTAVRWVGAEVDMSSIVAGPRSPSASRLSLDDPLPTVAFDVPSWQLHVHSPWLSGTPDVAQYAAESLFLVASLCNNASVHSEENHSETETGLRDSSAGNDSSGSPSTTTASSSPVAAGAGLSNGTGRRVVGDSTEVALLEFCISQSMSREFFLNRYGFERLHEIAFDSDRKRMSVAMGFPAGSRSSDLVRFPILAPLISMYDMAEDTCPCLILLKGAPEEVTNRSSRFLVVDQPVVSGAAGSVRFESKSTQIERKIASDFADLSSRGLRVLAMAMRLATKHHVEKFVKHQGRVDSVAQFPDQAIAGDTIVDIESDLVFIGLVGMADPPRKEVPGAIATCHAAGIRVCMITGDHVQTAVSIAKMIGLMPSSLADKQGDSDKPPDQQLMYQGYVMTGPYLASLSEEQLAQLNPFPIVFSRASPEGKLKIVRALQSRGEIVACGGDGVNDAPAINQADVGFAMALSGTELAREAADIVLLDDSYTSVVRAVEEGRRVYDNILKFLVYLLSCNFAEIIYMLVSVAAGLDPPMLSIMILYANIFVDVPPSLSLGLEPVESDAMTRPPRSPYEHILNRINATMIATEGLSMATLAIASYVYLQFGADRSVSYSRSASFVLLSLVQTWHSFLCRSIIGSSLRNWRLLLTGNRYLMGAFFISSGFMILGAYVPGLNDFLDLEPLEGDAWIMILIALITHTIMTEFFKLIVRRVFPRERQQRKMSGSPGLDGRSGQSIV